MAPRRFLLEATWRSDGDLTDEALERLLDHWHRDGREICLERDDESTFSVSWEAEASDLQPALDLARAVAERVMAAAQVPGGLVLATAVDDDGWAEWPEPHERRWPARGHGYTARLERRRWRSDRVIIEDAGGFRAVMPARADGQALLADVQRDLADLSPAAFAERYEKHFTPPTR